MKQPRMVCEWCGKPITTLFDDGGPELCDNCEDERWCQAQEEIEAELELEYAYERYMEQQRGFEQ